MPLESRGNFRGSQEGGVEWGFTTLTRIQGGGGRRGKEGKEGEGQGREEGEGQGKERGRGVRKEREIDMIRAS